MVLDNTFVSLVGIDGAKGIDKNIREM